MLGAFFQNIVTFPNSSEKGHDQALSNGVDRRIAHLGKKLFEVIRNVLALFGKYCQWGVCPHRSYCFLTLIPKWGQNYF